MKVMVAVKRVVDFNVRIRVKSDETAVDTSNAVMSMNPFDENAVEEALRMKQDAVASEVIVVSIGTNKSQDVLRKAMAMGADRALLINTEEDLEPLTKAKIFAKLVAQESAEIVIMGKQTIDGDSNQTGQMLAALLNWPQGTYASKVVFTEGQLILTRETDSGLETIQITLPAVLTADLRLNEPRFPTLPAIMQAKKKPLEIIEADSFGIDLTPRLKVIKVASPPQRKAGIKVADAKQLLEHLKSNGSLG